MYLRKKRLYQALLERQLLRASGNAFQQLFGTFMAEVFGDDFTQVRPAGSKGDGGCDGYRLSTRTVYQCFGKNASSAVNSKRIVNKINTDFATAKSNFPGDLMRGWTFAHNVIDGFPTEAVVAIVNLNDSCDVDVQLLSPSGIEKLLFAASETQLDDLFGLEKDRGEPLNPTLIQRLLKGISLTQTAPGDVDLRPVPLGKLEFNHLSEPASRSIRDNIKYAAQVSKFVNEDPNPLYGDSLANTLNDHYLSLRAQKLTPDEIMDEMMGFILGDRHDIDHSDFKAAEAIIAYFFSTCDVFDNLPQYA